MSVHDSKAYRKMDVTRECISRILKLREILLNLVNVAVDCVIRRQRQMCIRDRSFAVRVHDSKAYRKMDVTRKRTSCLLYTSPSPRDVG